MEKKVEIEVEGIWDSGENLLSKMKAIFDS